MNTAPNIICSSRLVPRLLFLFSLLGLFSQGPVASAALAQTDNERLVGAIRNVPVVDPRKLPLVAAKVPESRELFQYDQVAAVAAPIAQGTEGDNELMAYALPSNSFYVELLPPTNNSARLIVHGTEGASYELLSRVSLTEGDWQVEKAVPAVTNGGDVYTMVALRDRTNTLFFWARMMAARGDGSNLVPGNVESPPDAGAGRISGSANAGKGTVTDNRAGEAKMPEGNRNRRNKIRFSVSYDEKYINHAAIKFELKIWQGVPSSMAVLIDGTNYAGARWEVFSPHLSVNLGKHEGWHEIRIGLRGRTATSLQTWTRVRIKQDFTPPSLRVVKPADELVVQPVLQIKGISSELLSSISYDITNNLGFRGHQDAMDGESFDYNTNTLEFVGQGFYGVDVALARGTNVIDFHAVDLAGNVGMKRVKFVFDPSADKSPPVIALDWPLAGTRIAGDTFTWRGHLDDATAKLRVSTADPGTNASVTALVERAGDFWAEEIPLHGGTNRFAIEATDAAGNQSVTNVEVVRDEATLSIDPISSTNSTITGHVGLKNHAIWVNGKKAKVARDGSWRVENIAMHSSRAGTVLIVQARAISMKIKLEAPGEPDDPAERFVRELNPVFSGSIDCEVTVDREGGNFMSEFHKAEQVDYLVPHLVAANTYLIASEDSVEWVEGLGGMEQRVWWELSPKGTNQVTTEFVWPPSMWPYPLPTGTMRTSNSLTGTWTTNLWPHPPGLTNEYCDIDYVTPEGDRHIRKKQASDFHMATGGKGIAGRKSLWIINVGAIEVLDEVQTPAPQQKAPLEKLSFGGFGKPGPDGKIYVSLPDGLR